MFAVGIAIRDRLQAVQGLSAWNIRQDFDGADRHVMPAIEIRAENAAVPDSKAGAAMVQVTWAVHLITQRGPQAVTNLDAAFALVMGSLHNWLPGEIVGRGWEPLRLTGVTRPEYAEEGAAHYALMFNTAARYAGQS